jgi:hypothetical protein
MIVELKTFCQVNKSFTVKKVLFNQPVLIVFPDKNLNSKKVKFVFQNFLSYFNSLNQFHNGHAGATELVEQTVI